MKNYIERLIGHIISILLIYHDKYHNYKLRKFNIIHPTVKIGRFTRFPGSGTIKIDENSYVGINCFLEAHPENTKIIIGKNCALAHGIQIRTYSYTNWDGEKRGHKCLGDVVIGNGVWIGANVYIKGGITIGDGANIGANAVVLNDVPSYSTAVGVPAKIIVKSEM